MSPDIAAAYVDTIFSKLNIVVYKFIKKYHFSKHLLIYSLAFILLYEFVQIFYIKNTNYYSDYLNILVCNFFILALITALFSLSKNINNFFFIFVSLMALFGLNQNFLVPAIVFVAVNIIIIKILMWPDVQKSLYKSVGRLVVIYTIINILWNCLKYFQFSSQPYFPLQIRGVIFLYAPIIFFIDKKKELKNKLMFPFNWIFAMPTDSHEYSVVKKTNKKITIGLVSVLFGSQALYLLYLIKSSISFSYSGNNFFDFFKFGLYIYTYFYLFSFGISKVYYGCGNLIGHDWADPFDTPLLAHTPSERWRRWNTQYYNFYNRYLFFSLRKNGVSLFGCIFIIFIFSAVIHFDISSYNSTDLKYIVHSIKQLLIYFILHGLLVFISIKYPKMWGDKSKMTGWIGVLLTNFLMMAIHGFRYISI